MTESPLSLDRFEPESMLVVPEHLVKRAKFPVIDVHTHLSNVFGEEREPGRGGPTGKAQAQLRQYVEWMDQLNIRVLVNLTGGYGETLERNIAALDRAYPGRFLNCVEPAWDWANEPGYANWQVQELERAKAAGAIGLKVLKTLGLYLRERGGEGPLVKIDDPRFDPMWEAAGKLRLPVMIHSADPDAFFLPIDRFNERWDELNHHPDWSFYGKDFPAKTELLAARNRVIARHPNTTFIGLHMANHPENLDEVAAWLDRYANLHVEFAARLGEIGRQPRKSREFLEAYQDRIMFGTDASPNGSSVPQQDLVPGMYQAYFRFLETTDEYFDYAPSRVPPQGRWRISGTGLPDEVLRKIYYANAERLLGVDLGRG